MTRWLTVTFITLTFVTPAVTEMDMGRLKNP